MISLYSTMYMLVIWWTTDNRCQMMKKAQITLGQVN